MTSYIGVIGNVVASVGVMVQAEQEAQILEANAKSARQDARLAVLSASVRAEEVRRDADIFKGTQSATAAANGLVSTEGSPLLLLMRTAGEAERAAQREMFTGEVQAAKFITEANIYKRQAQNVRITGAIQAAATALSGNTFQHGSSQPRQSGSFSFNRSESAFQAQRAGERGNFSDRSDFSVYGSSGMSSDDASF